jgi:spore germination cell wall hydrolase CwlJ-like protein
MMALSKFGIFRGRRLLLPFPLSLGLASLPFQEPRRLVNAGAISTAIVISGLAFVAQGGLAGGTPVTRVQHWSLPPEPPPFLLRNVSEQDAIAINQRIPFSIEANVAAQPFRFQGDAIARSRALECLTMAVYYEAGSQDEAGQEAVAQVVLNRVRHPAFQPSVCGVVFQGYARKTGCQFTFTCDGSLLRAPDPKIWARAQQVAAAALSGFVFKPVGLATHYHADYVVPYWATSLEKNAQVGVHIFYRWPDAWGMPAAFSRRYAGNELDPASLRAAAIMNEADWANGAIAPDDDIQLATDPRTELLAVVQLLANGSSDLASADQRYAQDVKSYFATEADHPAVQQFRKLSKDNAGFAATTAGLLLGYSAPPELTAKEGSADAAGDKTTAQFIDALRDFARSSEFMRFFDGHRPFYRSVIRRTQQQAAMTRGYWEAYTGLALPARKLVLSSLAGTNDLGNCGEAGGVLTPPAVLSLGTLAQTNAAQTLLSTEGTQVGLDKPVGGKTPKAAKTSFKLNAAEEQQLIRAVFTRIAALSKGDAAGRLAVEQEVRGGFALVPTFDERLRYYETHRDQFATLADFLPQLMDGAGKASAKAAADGPEKTTAGQCGIQVAVAAPALPAGASTGQ